MIKLIVSDIDGTILPEGTDLINPKLYDAIRILREKGIRFAAASGRQYESMHHVFAPVADEIYFISENGTNIMYQGKNLTFVPLAQELAELGEGVRVWPSAANFLLVRVPNAHEVYGAMRDEFSILVRDFSRSADLSDCLRITVGTPEENDRVIAALKELTAR